MDNEIFKIIATLVLTLTILIILPIFISDYLKFERNIKCLEIGHQYIYENNSYICK